MSIQLALVLEIETLSEMIQKKERLVARAMEM